MQELKNSHRTAIFPLFALHMSASDLFINADIHIHIYVVACICVCVCVCVRWTSANIKAVGLDCLSACYIVITLAIVTVVIALHHVHTHERHNGHTYVHKYKQASICQQQQWTLLISENWLPVCPCLSNCLSDWLTGWITDVAATSLSPNGNAQWTTPLSMNSGNGSRSCSASQT